jgi:hypothetical protein
LRPLHPEEYLPPKPDERPPQTPAGTQAKAIESGKHESLENLKDNKYGNKLQTSQGKYIIDLVFFNELEAEND